MSKKSIVLLVVAVVLAAAVIAIKVLVMPILTVTIPEYQEPGKLVELDQNWTEAQRMAFHHTSQGTRLIPYQWFLALEQPCLSLGACEPFSSPQYLGRFGFLPDKTDPKFNPDGLPVGFARQEDFHDPIVPANSIPALGLTCAACHTGQMKFGGNDVRIEGAPAMIQVTQFQKALGAALLLTAKIPPFNWLRYNRFAEKVLGQNATDEQKKTLQKNLAAFMAPLVAETKYAGTNHIYDDTNDAGFVRTDALSRIGNMVFAVDMNNTKNFVPANAPVRFPQIWDGSWLKWVQYNSSISDPMVRNIGEALGVRAAVKLFDGADPIIGTEVKQSEAKATEFDNSVDVEGVWNLETLLAGDAPYKGLNSPKWPSVFPALDQTKVEKGAVLYKQYCAGCHLPPVPELVADLKSPKPEHWQKNGQGWTFLVVKDIPIEQIGTDQHEAMDFIARKADSGDLKLGILSAGDGLDAVTKGIRQQYYKKKGFSLETQIQWNGYRDPGDVAVRSPAVYKARPLNGIWAVSPYLHNGSVPNLYELLSPVSERSTSFWVGNETFDPVKVGHDTSELKGGTLFKVSSPGYDVKGVGNSNAGHEFNDGPKGKGVIGPRLSPDDRNALIEYLKSI